MSTQQTEEEMMTVDWVSKNAEYIDFSKEAAARANEPDTEPESDTDYDTDSEDKRDGDYYIVRHEMCIYDKDGEVSEMDIIYEEEFDHLRDAREMYNEIKVKPYGELVYLDMITCDGSDQDNIDCRGTMKKE
tara:strand:- start:398 stop:793 length:396 start_codon:yes stop_codon:yes gene_type:complete